MRISHIGFIILTITLLSACEQNKHLKDLKGYVNRTREALVGDESSKTHVVLPTLPKPIVYRSYTLRSPFAAKEVLSHKRIILHPLQAYSLSMLRFVGTVTQQYLIYAVILAPDGKIYQAKVGDEIGDNQGKITKIDSDLLQVVEQYKDEAGHIKKHVITLQLKEENTNG